MKKRKIRLITVVTLIVFTLSSVSAFAESTYSAWKTTGKIYSRTYKYRSGLMSSSTMVQARGHAEVATGSNAKAGYIGVRASLYKSSGQLYKSGTWDYNDSSCVGVDIPGGKATVNGTYYCISKFKFYNGNGYSSTYTANRSPNIKLSRTTTTATELDLTVKTNEKQQTYGSGLVEMFGQECPDLIAAIGEGNVEGYVLAEDLDKNLCRTLQEARETQLLADQKEIDYIPLYDKNGIEIGIFKLETIGATEIQ